MFTSKLTWYDHSVLPRQDIDSTASSERVIVSYDGESIAAVAIYDYKVMRWYDCGAGGFRLIDDPLCWAYANFDEVTTIAEKGGQRCFPVGSRWRCPSMSLYSGETQPGIIEITKKVGPNSWEYKIIDGMEGDMPPYKFDVYGMMAERLTALAK